MTISCGSQRTIRLGDSKIIIIQNGCAEAQEAPSIDLFEPNHLAGLMDRMAANGDLNAPDEAPATPRVLTPAMRRCIAEGLRPGYQLLLYCLMEGMGQRTTATMMGLTQGAVSHAQQAVKGWMLRWRNCLSVRWEPILKEYALERGAQRAEAIRCKVNNPWHTQTKVASMTGCHQSQVANIYLDFKHWMGQRFAYSSNPVQAFRHLPTLQTTDVYCNPAAGSLEEARKWVLSLRASAGEAVTTSLTPLQSTVLKHAARPQYRVEAYAKTIRMVVADAMHKMGYGLGADARIARSCIDNQRRQNDEGCTWVAEILQHDWEPLLLRCQELRESNYRKHGGFRPESWGKLQQAWTMAPWLSFRDMSVTHFRSPNAGREACRQMRQVATPAELVMLEHRGTDGKELALGPSKKTRVKPMKPSDKEFAKRYAAWLESLPEYLGMDRDAAALKILVGDIIW